MAKVTEPRLGGLTKDQEREVADQVERSLGLNPKHGWLRNADNILANRKKIYGMLDEDWDKMFRELPYYGEFQAQDIDAIQEYFLDKYPIKKFLDIPTIPSDAAYQKIMSISPDALSGVKATGLYEYEGPWQGGTYSGQMKAGVPEGYGTYIFGEGEDPGWFGEGEDPGWNPQGLREFGPEGEESYIEEEFGPEGVPLLDNSDIPISAFKGLGIGGAGKFTRMVESMTTQELFDAGYIDSITKEERDRKDRRHQQGVEAQRRARQYDAIAKRLWT